MGFLYYDELGGTTQNGGLANPGPFANLYATDSGTYFWTGTSAAREEGADEVWYFSFFFANQCSTGGSTSYLYAMAVHSGDVLGNGVVLPNGPTASPVQAMSKAGMAISVLALLGIAWLSRRRA
jgi:hypothetical protein